MAQIAIPGFRQAFQPWRGMPQLSQVESELHSKDPLQLTQKRKHDKTRVAH